MRVSQDVLAVLDRATCEGNALSLTDLGQLDRKLYTDTNKVLEAAGGKWNRKAKAHLFDGDAAEAIEPIILTGEIVSIRQELQQFYTPAILAERVISEARIEAGMSVLEPSAGRGALAAPAYLLGALVDCVELDPKNVHLLASIAFNSVLEGDFLAVDFDPDFDDGYDRVVMNPPFTRGQDVRHVTHAVQFLKPGGRLVAIMSASIRFRQEPLFAGFRAFLDQHNATVEDLPVGSFKASGTGVNACLVSFDVGGE
ncbi:methyltransferase [Methylobacterium gnaphalii]|uniref:Lambda phage type II DNA modification methyltransferase n=1 Tax=Methylobacterium gnaphalii TaxID=1010610 RepID=A0A512JIS5_9HYPH|nr:methyltransferase [Methylobacterium gnaphalii]GEP09865.1 lambda phage type II DNA modification methyltransferase [Methylobacterium gnaphalii]GJD67219.1 hypothetical protein MMMDOFMJ_0133 [Methylobacterium gnaphalii]GLS49894.1 lambda phage type II DNA modification methyltransferase [Methylobacterium gnaphalii]